jgi:Protein of unknown function (DUF3429)
MIGQTLQSLPRGAAALGLLGLLPQLLAVINALEPEYRYIGLSAGFFYAALIFSFVGGIWWGIAIGREAPPVWLFGAAVMPTLIAFGTGIPWMIGGTWPWPSLMVLGGGLLLSPLVDVRLLKLGWISRGFFALRLVLSGGIGSLTLLLAFL